MPTEQEWAASLAPGLATVLKPMTTSLATPRVECARRLQYALEVREYRGAAIDRLSQPRYSTDLLVFDQMKAERWIPRIVIECKFGRVTTHDALTYSAKAATHKTVHPYLRYGVLIGGHGSKAIPGRLVRHGAGFDFLMAWVDAKPSDEEWSRLGELLGEELLASRRMQELLTTSRNKGRVRYAIVHRQLVLRE